MLRRTAADILAILAVLAVIALVVGQLTGQPVLLGYVTSGSMSPTLEAGDGFVAVPATVSDDIESGDVVVFDAIELQGGGLTTHRVVEITEDGYITRGDNNPFRDQEGEEPAVTEDRVVATALQINGQVVRIPGLGTGIGAVRDSGERVQAAVAGVLGLEATGPRALSGVFISIGLVLLLIVFADDIRGRQGRDRTRNRSRFGDQGIDGRWVALGLVFLILVPANIALYAPTGTQQVVLDGDDLSTGTTVGDSVETQLTAENNGLITMLVFLETSHPNAELSRTELPTPSGGSAMATLTVTAPPPGEQTVVTISEHWYFLVVPPAVIAWLHSIHPLVAVGAFNVLVIGSVLTLVGATFGFSQRRVRPRRRDVSLRLLIKRLLR
ncbi:signal peptidase I [Halorubrum ezzemoulense]|uniref:Signal peptidase I n=1 Tax=Halorubrum ezzemoulense TaxID=337243 RepID=A0ABT4Z623_HALEZ|nr:signal peptidase I [Halorubrum ezzemoulense]MDB2246538.1 signal peptidase I [Halorubrum ezzemoulense]MDB2280195.1 signal peptidase I [Halorubrum ezzemoulense]MDB2290624.1 signal peptidase I [Halorubrum ezzemoulense]MDB2293608.1 signal peptidase I [Halorubrum ezzemoulense]MDB2298090.1 signal peptidase I [Halorubrum ezzemoulense]